MVIEGLFDAAALADGWCGVDARQYGAKDCAGGALSIGVHDS